MAADQRLEVNVPKQLQNYKDFDVLLEESARVKDMADEQNVRAYFQFIGKRFDMSVARDIWDALNGQLVTLQYFRSDQILVWTVQVKDGKLYTDHDLSDLQDSMDTHYLELCALANGSGETAKGSGGVVETAMRDLQGWLESDGRDVATEATRRKVNSLAKELRKAGCFGKSNREPDDIETSDR